MVERFRNRHDWFTLGAALGLWAAHFGLLWTASSIFPDQPAARWLALVLTIAAFAGLAWLWLRSQRPAVASVAGLGLLIAAIGTAFDALPALVG